ncbi:MAG: class III poly(R)-hydroxyalkanoic acid synthase subunit PhaC, partial [Candidatus Sericytochromatia bacterium]
DSAPIAQKEDPTMLTTVDWIEKARAEFEKNLKRTEAAARYALQPQTAQVGQTPKDIVWTKNKAKLYRYHAQGERRHATPLLLVYALINKPYILDLAPGNSFVEYLVGQGYDVFMLDWGVPGEEDAGLTLDDYVLDYIPRAVKAVLKASGQSEFSLLGYCQGGTLSTLYAAAHPEAPIKNLILLTTPVDFDNAGLYTEWLNPKHFNVDRVAEAFPLVPADMLQLGSKLLKPLQNYVGPYMMLWDRLDDADFVQGWHVMNTWVDDGIPFAGAAYRQWVKDFYQGNKLIKGEVVLGGKQILLENIRCSLLVVYATLDHIVPQCQALPAMDLVGSDDKQALPVKAGHVGVVAGRSAKRNFFPQLDEWLSARSK